MAKFRKKPVEVEAVRARDAIRLARDGWWSLPSWLAHAYDCCVVVFSPNGVDILTPEGAMRAGVDDWIIQGVKGEIYPCKPDVFKEAYERVDEDTSNA